MKTYSQINEEARTRTNIQKSGQYIVQGLERVEKLARKGGMFYRMSIEADPGLKSDLDSFLTNLQNLMGEFEDIKAEAEMAAS